MAPPNIDDNISEALPAGTDNFVLQQFRLARTGTEVPLTVGAVMLAALGSGDDRLLAEVRLVEDLDWK